MLKVIETLYQGYRFRSRMEARFAVMLDTLHITWQYEKEGYILADGAWYLPDFWLPELDCWIELKGQAPTKEECEKARGLTSGTHKVTYILYGDFGPYRTEVVHLMSLRESKRLFESTGAYHETTDFKDYGLHGHGFYPTDDISVDDCLFDTCHSFHECTSCHRLTINLACYMSRPNVPARAIPKLDACVCGGLIKNDTPRLIAAYTAARQARFEHTNGQGTAS